MCQNSFGLPFEEILHGNFILCANQFHIDSLTEMEMVESLILDDSQNANQIIFLMKILRPYSPKQTLENLSVYCAGLCIALIVQIRL